MKKHAKKLACLVAILCVLLTSAGSVYADDTKIVLGEEGAPASTEVPVSAYRTDSGETEKTILSVSITWSYMLFEYQEGFKGTWNPEELCYEGAIEEKWNIVDSTGNIVNNGNRIDLYNRSEVPIRAAFTFESKIPDASIIYKFVDDTGENPTDLKKYEDGGYYVDMPISTAESIKNVPVELVITDGEIPDSVSGFTKDSPGQLGTITITISEATDSVS